MSLSRTGALSFSPLSSRHDPSSQGAAEVAQMKMTTQRAPKILRQLRVNTGRSIRTHERGHDGWWACEGVVLMELGYKPKKSASRHHPVQCDPISHRFMLRKEEVALQRKIKMVLPEGGLDSRQAKPAEVHVARMIYSCRIRRKEPSRQRDNTL